MDMPPRGLTTGVELVEVHDGDTVRVKISYEIDVRLLDCWAPELKEAGGIEAAVFLRNLLIDAKELTLHVPASGRRRLGDLLTLSRVRGRLFTPDGRDASEVMVESNHARRSKP